MKKFLLYLIPILFSTMLFAQEEEKITTKLSGYIRYEAIFETYESVTTRDGELILYPSKPNFDLNNEDININNNFNMLSLQSRVKLAISGKSALGAKTSGVIEVDFLGTSQALVRTIRLRHAFMKLDWGNTNLILGNTWHPMFLPEMFPHTLTFGAGMPFHPLNRSPQIRVTHNFTENISLVSAALVNGYNKSSGPIDAQRNSSLPEFQIQPKLDFGMFLFGFTAGYKWLTPRLNTSFNYITDETIGSYNFQTFLRIKTDPVVIRTEFNIGENMTNYVMIGGYGIKTNTIDALDNYEYTNLKSMSAIIDIETKMGDYDIGIYGGYMENLGSKDDVTLIPGYTRGEDLDYLYRIAPRISKSFNQLNFGLEYNLTTAIWGETFDSKQKAITVYDPVYNHRFLFTAKYSF